jgi:hypothetical protein
MSALLLVSSAGQTDVACGVTHRNRLKGRPVKANCLAVKFGQTYIMLSLQEPYGPIPAGAFGVSGLKPKPPNPKLSLLLRLA